MMEPAAWVLTVQRLRMSSGMFFVYSFRAGAAASNSVSVICIPRFIQSFIVSISFYIS